jgi:TPR repeat protein
MEIFYRRVKYANENFKGGEFAVSGLSDSDCEIAATYYYSLAQYTSAQYGRPGVGHVDQVLLREDDFEGFGGEEDDAVQYHQQEADNGDVPSQLWLGKRYFWGGGGIQPDPVRAQQYFERAAQQGNPEAQYNLGVMLMSGDAAPPDPAASLNYFEQAAAAGFAPAQNGLASQYLSGRGAVAQNLTRAFEYVTVARRQWGGCALRITNDHCHFVFAAR